MLGSKERISSEELEDQVCMAACMDSSAVSIKNMEAFKEERGHLAVRAAESHQWEERELWCPSELKSEAKSQELSWRCLEDP